MSLDSVVGWQNVTFSVVSGGRNYGTLKTSEIMPEEISLKLLLEVCN